VLTDGRDKRLVKWLEGTNWPEGFTWDLSISLVQDNYIAQKLVLKYELEHIELLLNPNRLTKTDYETAINIAIKRMQDSGKIIQETKP
jgi:hypothetical protein